jgi:hypothetical protein
MDGVKAVAWPDMTGFEERGGMVALNMVEFTRNGGVCPLTSLEFEKLGGMVTLNMVFGGKRIIMLRCMAKERL